MMADWLLSIAEYPEAQCQPPDPIVFASSKSFTGSVKLLSY
jgi:hypothetical protein